MWCLFPDKFLVKLWAKYRWGVDNENYEEGDEYKGAAPYYLDPWTGEPEGTRCSQEIKGGMQYPDGSECVVDRHDPNKYPDSCRFVPDNAGQTAEASLMFSSIVDIKSVRDIIFFFLYCF